MSESVTRLLLIRHAHANTGAPPGCLCGWFDPPLSSKGQAQLRALASQQGSRNPPAALYTSTLARARDVAAALGQLWCLPVQALADLREIHCGRLDGMPIEGVAHDYPEIWARNRAQLDDDFTWPGGESYREFRGRILDALSSVAARHRGSHVAVVTHAGVIAQVLGTLKGRPAAVWEQDRPSFLTATEILWSHGAPSQVLRFAAREWA